MSESVNESLNEAIAELKSKTLISEVYHMVEQNKNLPGDWIQCTLAVLHQIPGKDGWTWSTKVVYIKDESPYEYRFHYGGTSGEDTVNTTYDFFYGKLSQIKTAKDFDLVEIESCDESKESVIIYCLKENIDKLATISRVKCWKTGETTWDYLIISIETVE